MFKSLKAGMLCAAVMFGGAVSAAPLGIGSPATPEEIAGWDIDIRPDGVGLPPGEGTVAEGETLYEAQCASCHGLFGEGEGRWPYLAGGENTLDTNNPKKTVGSYWPYASTLWDYIHRAMPYQAPQSLTDDEVYAISAYVLYLNYIVEDDFVANAETFAEVKMPNEPNFYVDNRPDVLNERCMKDCADPAQFEIVTTINGVTPTGHFKEDSGVADNHYGRSEQSVEVASTDGGVLYGMVCASCHGANGEGAGAFPQLSGQSAEDIADKLTRYKNGETIGDSSALMWGVAAGLEDRDIQDIAEYVETL